MSDTWHDYLVDLIHNRSSRAHVEWKDLVTALEKEGFTIRDTAHGFLAWHPLHPNGKTVNASKPHEGGSSSLKVKRPYINKICDYLGELPAFENAKNVGGEPDDEE